MMFVSSCSSMENKISLAMNVNALLTDLDNQYAAPEVDKISANLEINAGFAVYFTNTGCSSCETFSPIMDEYLIKSKEFKIYSDNINLSDDKRSLYYLNLDDINKITIDGSGLKTTTKILINGGDYNG